jgi:hypothetical protein
MISELGSLELSDVADSTRSDGDDGAVMSIQASAADRAHPSGLHGHHGR